MLEGKDDRARPSADEAIEVSGEEPSGPDIRDNWSHLSRLDLGGPIEPGQRHAAGGRLEGRVTAGGAGQHD